MNEEAIARVGPQSQKKMARRLLFHSIIFSLCSFVVFYPMVVDRKDLTGRRKVNR